MSDGRVEGERDFGTIGGPVLGRWDAPELSVSPSQLQGWIGSVLHECGAFGRRHRGGLSNRTAAEWAVVLRELCALRSRLLWLDSASALRLALNVRGEAELDQRAAVDAALDEADDLLRFVETEWAALDEVAARVLLHSGELSPHRHFLAAARRLAPHLLSDSEERALAACEPAAELAWIALYDRYRAGLEVRVRGHPTTVAEALACLRDAEPAVRAAALEGLEAALEPPAAEMAHCYDTLVANRLSVGALRGFERPRAARDLLNELPPEVVDRMLEAVDGRCDLAQAWFARKAALLGLQRLRAADDRAPLPAARPMAYPDAAHAIVEAFAELAPEAGGIARQLLRDGRVDAEPRPGKQGTACCRSLAPDALPFVLVNYRGRADDALTLAHELGHGVHFALAGRTQSVLSFAPPAVLSEVPSTFAELLVADWLIEREPDAGGRLALAARRVETCVEAVFLSTVLTRFEEGAHELRERGQALLPDRLEELWMEASSPCYGAAVERSAGHGRHWALVPHLVHEPFSTYAYAFAQLACLALLAVRRRGPAAFAGRCLAFLARGGSAPPLDQLSQLGFDARRPGAWEMALDELQRLLAALPQ